MNLLIHQQSTFQKSWYSDQKVTALWTFLKSYENPGVVSILYFRSVATGKSSLGGILKCCCTIFIDFSPRSATPLMRSPWTTESCPKNKHLRAPFGAILQQPLNVHSVQFSFPGRWNKTTIYIPLPNIASNRCGKYARNTLPAKFRYGVGCLKYRISFSFASFFFLQLPYHAGLLARFHI